MMSRLALPHLRVYSIVGLVLLLFGVPAAVSAATGTPNDNPEADVAFHSAIIDNGTIQLGVLDHGLLGVAPKEIVCGLTR